ncbi:MAG: hypothetical protein M3Y07_04980 [Acidobacteriota bacterium]|nr:hypothetical protein [Acidobacteriota bacterium]
MRDAVDDVSATVWKPKERQEYLAILARWFYSSWRDGEFLLFDSFENVPYRKPVGAISRVSKL